MTHTSHRQSSWLVDENHRVVPRRWRIPLGSTAGVVTSGLAPRRPNVLEGRLVRDRCPLGDAKVGV
jgi:hypothetical protein